jgi:hypothetical protein
VAPAWQAVGRRRIVIKDESARNLAGVTGRSQESCVLALLAPGLAQVAGQAHGCPQYDKAS